MAILSEETDRYDAISNKNPMMIFFHRDMVIKIVQSSYINRHVDQWNKIENTYMISYRYSHLILFYKNNKSMHWKKEASSTHSADIYLEGN